MIDSIKGKSIHFYMSYNFVIAIKYKCDFSKIDFESKINANENTFSLSI